MLGGLQLGGVGRQEAEADGLGDTELAADVPAGVVEYENDDRVGADVRGEGVEHGLEEVDADGVGEPPVDRAARRVDEAVEIEPTVLVVADGDRPPATPGPDAPPQGLQAEPVLVEGPDLDTAPLGLGPRRRHRPAKFFLNAAHSAGVAERACRGRGRCRLNSRRCR